MEYRPQCNRHRKVVFIDSKLGLAVSRKPDEPRKLRPSSAAGTEHQPEAGPEEAKLFLPFLQFVQDE